MITVTVEPIRYFTEAIAGNRFAVASIVPKGSSPETYDPTPRQLIELVDSKAYLRIGYIGFERTLADRLAKNTPTQPFYDLSQGIDLIRDETHAGLASGVEPHIWNSTVNARIIAANIRDALTDLDRSGRSVYASRCDSLCRHIAATDSILRVLLSSPGADSTFLIYHPALSYFARDYGLHQISIEESGKEPSPARLKELIDRCRREKVNIIFVQPEFDRRNAELIARQIDARVVAVNPLSYDWEQEMLHAARELCATGKE